MLSARAIHALRRGPNARAPVYVTDGVDEFIDGDVLNAW